MNCYITGRTIKKMREEKGITQAMLADAVSVTAKAVSKWETGKCYPDIALLEPIAATLGVSVTALLSGTESLNRNKSFNMKRISFYICPVCGNIITATGEAKISCCGIELNPAEIEEADESHSICIEPIEDEYYITLNHEMTKEHYVSFIAAVRDNAVDIVKQYCEGACEARFKQGRISDFYIYCNKHGLFKTSGLKALKR